MTIFEKSSCADNQLRRKRSLVKQSSEHLMPPENDLGNRSELDSAASHLRARVKYGAPFSTTIPLGANVKAHGEGERF